jgi:hypothetical protein
LNWSGVPTGTPYELIGTSATDGFNFSSGTRTSTGASEIVPVTADDLGTDVERLVGSISWSVVINPGPNQVVLTIGSTTHTVYVTYSTPRTDGPYTDALQPTKIRMSIANLVVGEAFDNAKTAAQTEDPTPHRIVYETAQMQRFNLYYTPVDDYKPNVHAWDVYESWFFQAPADPGADCISDASFAVFVLLMEGLPGDIDAIPYTAKSGTELTTAVAYDENDANRYRNNSTEELIMLDSRGNINYFEAAVVYTYGGTTGYFPIMPIGKAVPPLNHADKVLLVMTMPAWAKKGGAVVQELAVYGNINSTTDYIVLD